MARTQHHRTDANRCLKYLIFLALVAALVYFVNRWIVIPLTGAATFYTDYLGDVLALPVYLPLSFYLALKLNIITEPLRLSWLHVLVAVFVFSTVFEGIVPLLVKSSTRDPWDILAYLSGGLIVLGVSLACKKHPENIHYQGVAE